MDLEKFFERMNDEDVRLSDIPILALIILLFLAVVIVEIGCVVWFFSILIYALACGVAKLLLLIPCITIFSILTAIIFYAGIKLDIID